MSNDGLESAVDRKERYGRIFSAGLGELELSQGQMAVWLALKNTKTTREAVRKKCRGETVTPKDIALMSLLRLLKGLGYDLGKVVMSEDGEILALPKKDDQAKADENCTVEKGPGNES